MSPKKELAVPVRNSSTANGVHEDQDDQDLFAGMFHVHGEERPCRYKFFGC